MDEVHAIGNAIVCVYNISRSKGYLLECFDDCPSKIIVPKLLEVIKLLDD
jgi:hypothetical protein